MQRSLILHKNKQAGLTMFSIQLQNPLLEKLAKEIFTDKPVTENPQLLEFLQQQKINKDLNQSIADMNKENTVDIDEAFDQTLKQLGI